MANILPSAINKGTIRSNGQRYSISSDTNGFLTVGKNDTFSNFNTADYANDSACIQAGLDMATTSGKNLLIQSGNYTITTSLLLIDKSNLTISGQGNTNLIVRLTTIPNPGNPNVTSLGGYQSGLYLRRCTNVRITNLIVDTLDSAPVVVPLMAIRVQACKKCYIDHISGFSLGGSIFIDANTGEDTDTVYVEDCILTGCGNGDVIGGGPQNSSGTCNVRNLFIRNNTIKQDLTSPLQFNNYTFCINIVRVDEISITGNKTYGDIAFGSEQQPHLYSQLSNNIIKPAIGATASLILTADFFLTSSNLQSGYYSISDNVMQNGVIAVRGKASASANNIIISNNICSYIDLIDTNLSIIEGNRITQSNTLQTGISLVNSNNNLISSNLISNFTNGITNTGTGNSFFSNKYVSVLNNTP